MHPPPYSTRMIPPQHRLMKFCRVGLGYSRTTPLPPRVSYRGGDGGIYPPHDFGKGGISPPSNCRTVFFLMGILVKSFKKVFRRQIPFFSKFVFSNCPPINFFLAETLPPPPHPPFLRFSPTMFKLRLLNFFRMQKLTPYSIKFIQNFLEEHPPDPSF